MYTHAFTTCCYDHIVVPRTGFPYLSPRGGYDDREIIVDPNVCGSR